MSICNIFGQLFKVIINETNNPGYYKAEFDSTYLPSGLYIYKIEAGNYTESKKMILVK